MKRAICSNGCDDLFTSLFMSRNAFTIKRAKAGTKDQQISYASPLQIVVLDTNAMIDNNSCSSGSNSDIEIISGQEDKCSNVMGDKVYNNIIIDDDHSPKESNHQVSSLSENSVNLETHSHHHCALVDGRSEISSFMPSRVLVKIFPSREFITEGYRLCGPFLPVLCSFLFVGIYVGRGPSCVAHQPFLCI